MESSFFGEPNVYQLLFPQLFISNWINNLITLVISFASFVLRLYRSFIILYGNYVGLLEKLALVILFTREFSLTCRWLSIHTCSLNLEVFLYLKYMLNSLTSLNVGNNRNDQAAAATKYVASNNMINQQNKS